MNQDVLLTGNDVDYLTGLIYTRLGAVSFGPDQQECDLAQAIAAKLQRHRELYSVISDLPQPEILTKG